MLYSTKQFQIDFEVYARGYCNDNNVYDPQHPNNIHFVYEGSEYILFELTLFNEKSEQGQDYYETELGCCISENEEVQVEDLQWRVTYYYSDATDDIENSYNRTKCIELPHDHTLPEQILEKVRAQWPEMFDFDVKFLREISGQ